MKKSWYEKTRGLSKKKGMVFNEYLFDALMLVVEVDWPMIPEISRDKKVGGLKDKKDRAKMLINSVYYKPAVDSIRDAAEAFSLAVEAMDGAMMLLDEHGGQGQT